MRINKLGTLFGVLWFAVSSGAAVADVVSTKVALYPAGIQLNYNQPVRLSRVLQDTTSRLNFAPYWVGAKLFDLDKQPRVDQQLKAVQQTLSVLQSEYPDDVGYQAVFNQLNQYQYGFRQMVRLDPDFVRLDTSLNPRLPGRYALRLVPRPKTITVMGVVNQVAHLPFVATMTVADYLGQENVNKLGDANQSFAWIITPDGQSRRVGYAYWNDQQAVLIPGSILFLGFCRENHQHQMLETHIVHLLGAIKGSL